MCHTYNLCQPNKGQVTNTSRVKFQSLIKLRKKTSCKPTSCEKSNPEIFAFFLKICQKLLCIQQLSHFTFYLPTAVSTYLIKMLFFPFKNAQNSSLVLTLIGTREGTFHPLSFLDQILSAEYFSEISKLFWR